VEPVDIKKFIYGFCSHKILIKAKIYIFGVQFQALDTYEYEHHHQ